METKLYKVDQLGGMVEGYRQRPDVADLIVDMRLDSMGAWREACGWRSIYDLDSQSGLDPFVSAGIKSIETIHWFSQHNGARQWLVWEHVTSAGDLELVYHSGPLKNFVTIETGRTLIKGPWSRTQYLGVGGWLYYINGHDAPMRWNGRRRVRIGFDRLPPAPTAQGPDQNFVDIDWSLIERPRTTHGGATTVNPWAAGGALSWEGVENPAQSKGLGERAEDGTSGAQNVPGPRTFWRYGYAVTFINDLGQESPPSPISYCSGHNYGWNPAQPTDWTGGGKTVSVVRVQDAPAWVRGIRLYRTGNVAAATAHELLSHRLFLHTEADCSRGFSVIDDKPDYELGPELDTGNVGPFPRGAKYMALFKGRMWVSGMPEYPDRVAYSAAGLIEQFPALNYFSIGDALSGEPTGLYATKNALVVFKSQGVYLIKGDNAAGLHAQTLTEDVGCVAPRAVVEVPGLGLLFVSTEGVYLLEGALENTGTPTRVVHLGQAIQRTWERKVNRSALMNAFAVVNRRDKEVWIHVPSVGSSTPNIGLVYHYEANAWSTRVAYPWNCGAVSADHRAYAFFGSWSTTAGERGVMVYSPGEAAKGGATVEGAYTSAWVDFGSVWGRTGIVYAMPYILGYGARDLTLDWHKDRAVPWEATAALPSRDAEKVLPKWGTAEWSATETWTDYPQTPVRFDLRQAMAMEFQWRVRSNRIRLVSMGLGIGTNPKEGMVKLSEALAPKTR